MKVLTGFSHVYHPDGLLTTLLPQGCILGTVPSVELAGGTRIPRTRDGMRCPVSQLPDQPIAMCSWWTPPSPWLLLKSHMPPSSAVCPEWSARGFLIWLLWRQMLQQQYSHMQGKTQVKTMIPKISNIFSTKSHMIWTIDLLSPPGCEANTQWIYLCPKWFNKDYALAHSSCMHTQHSVWIMAQVSTCKAVIMSKAIHFEGQLSSSETFQCSVKTVFADYHLGLTGWI